MPDWFNRLLEKFAAVEGSGIVGKLCRLGCFVFLAIGAGFWHMPDATKEVAELMLTAMQWSVGAYLGVVAGSFLFAVLNPLAANMVSGDHARVHEQIVRKGQPASVPTANVPAPQPEVAEIAPSEAEQAEVVKEPAQ